MTRPVVFRLQALREIDEAAAWYHARDGALSMEFLRALDVAVGSIESRPLQHPLVHGGLRRALLRRFPYSLIYSSSEEETVVLACVHWRQNPRRWRDRR